MRQNPESFDKNEISMPKSQDKTQMVTRVVMAALRIIVGSEQPLTAESMLGSAGLGHGVANRKQYFPILAVMLREEGWTLTSWPSEKLSGNSTVMDLIQLVVLHSTPGPKPSGKVIGSTFSASVSSRGAGRTQRDRPRLKDVQKKLAAAEAQLSSGLGSPLYAQKETPATAEKECFFFGLEGPSVRGNEIGANSSAELVFDYAVPPMEALATVDAQALSDARAASLDVSLLVTPRGSVAVEGTGSAVASFKDGKLLAPIAFVLHAAGPGAASVHVLFCVKGQAIHEAEIALAVVADSSIARSTLEARGLDTLKMSTLARRAYVAPPHRIGLNISTTGDLMRVVLLHTRSGQEVSQDEYQSTILSRLELSALLGRIHKALEGCYQSESFWKRFSGVPAPDVHEDEAKFELAELREAVAVAGAVFNEGLRKDPRIAEALDYVQKNLPDDGILAINTDTVFLPWELLYPRHRTSNWSKEERLAVPVDPKLFWGAKFAIETDKRGVGSIGDLRDLHLKAAPKVSLNLNPRIAIGGLPEDRQPVQVQKAWAARFGASVQESCEQVRAVVKRAETDATLVYVYCHGRSPNLFGGDDEQLELDDNCYMGPSDLLEGKQFKSAPIVFLSSCMGAVSSPLVFSSFLGEFRKRGAIGMIGTSYSVPIAFAAAFGEEVVNCYVNRKVSLSQELLALRRRHLFDAGNVIPLFYALQCSLD